MACGVGFRVQLGFSASILLGIELFWGLRSTASCGM